MINLTSSKNVNNRTEQKNGIGLSFETRNKYAQTTVNLTLPNFKMIQQIYVFMK